MTFTNKAATEMKDRILQKLILLAKPASEMDENGQKELAQTMKALNLTEELIQKRAASCLNQILHNYGMFSVMTIDKFTHKVIRTFSKELGLSLDFDVELDIKTLRKNVTDVLFDQIGRNKELTTLMVHYADSNLRDDKTWNFKNQLFEFSAELFKEDAIAAVSRLKKLEAKDFIAIRKELIEDREKFKSKLQKLGSDAMEIINFHGLIPQDFHGLSTGIANFFKNISKGKTDEPSKTIINGVADGKWAHKTSSNIPTVESIVPDLENYFAQIMDLFETEYPYFILHNEILRNLNNLSLMSHILKVTEEIKQEENILLITDFYKMIADIIIEEPVPFIYERLGVRYEHFLLDEFQDTSHLQWINLIPLLHNSLAQQKTNLIVGDGKQAIYRWRNGEVEQFVKLPNELHNPNKIQIIQDAQSTFAYEGEKINLKANWRSAPEIVHFNNAFFGDISSNHEYISKIYHEGDQIPQQSFKGYLEFNLKDDLDDEERFEYVLQSINKAIQKGFSLKDICLLVNTNKEGSAVAKFLSESGIKVISQDSLFVGKDVSVKFLFSLIAALSFPRNLNYRMKCIEHLVQIDPSSNTSEIWEDAKNSNLPMTTLFKKINRFVSSPESFHSFYEYVEHLIEKFQLDLSYNVYLRYFLEQVHQFEKQHSTNIQAFISWFNSKGREASVTSPEGLQAVQVMTIHKSKGLEFPIVIIPYFDWSLSDKKPKKWIADDQYPLPSFFLSPTPSTKKTHLKIEMEAEEVKHEMDNLNKVYVAFTRPEIALFVCGLSKTKNTVSKEWLSSFLKQNEGKYGIELVDNSYQIGELIKPESKTKTITDLYEFDFFKFYADRSTFSLKGEFDDSFEKLEAKRQYGSELHLVLSMLNSVQDCHDILQKLLFKGKISKENHEKLEADVHRLFADPHFAAYFNSGENINERPIIDELGKAHIPDKIIIKPNETLVVDYKTGEEHSDKYEKQLLTYINLLKEMGSENVRGEIYYTSNSEVTMVPSV